MMGNGRFFFFVKVAGYNKHTASRLLVQSCALYYSSGSDEFKGCEYITCFFFNLQLTLFSYVV